MCKKKVFLKCKNVILKYIFFSKEVQRNVSVIEAQGLAPARKKILILVHITTQGRTQWRTPPRFDPRFLLYFHKIVRLTATGLSISTMPFVSPKEPLSF